MLATSYTRTLKINLGQAIEDYLQTLDSAADKSNFLTALCRYTLPSFAKIKRPKGKRMSNRDQLRMIEEAKSIEIKKPEEVSQKQQKYFDKINFPKEDRYSYESRINSFVDFILMREGEQKSSADNKGKPRNKSKYNANLIESKRRLGPVLALDKYPDHLEKELIDYENFLLNSPDLDIRSKNTAKNNIYAVKKLLGWLYLTKKISYEEISLSKIVPFVKLYNYRPNQQDQSVDCKEFWMNFAYQKLQAEWQCKDIGLNLVRWLKDFFRERDLNPCSIVSEICKVINVAKYIYRKETDVAVNDEFEDVPVVTILKKLRNAYDKEAKVLRKLKNQNTDGKMLPWEKLLDLLEIKRQLFEHQTYKDGRKVVKMHILADDLQRFLMLACFTIMPPDRKRTFVELTYGKTLQHGLYDEKFLHFTPIDQMANPKEAKYYIRLEKGEYKTWKTYGVWTGEIPNKEFPDGKRFYDYWNQWFFDGYVDKDGNKHGYRDALNPQTDRVFVNQNGDAIAAGSFTDKIKRLVYGEYKIPVTPHTIRHIYVNHVHTLKLDEATLDSIARWMKHSLEEAKKTYTHLTNPERLVAAQTAIRIVPGLH